MRVALDGTPLTENIGGIKRYTEELSSALALAFPSDEFYLVCDRPFEMPPDCPPNLESGHGPRSFPERKWWLWGLQREISRLHVDVFHGTDFSVPYLPLRPSVITIHDLSPWLDPLWHVNADRVRRRTPLLLRMGLATMVITPTEAVRKQVMDRFGLAAERVVAVPLAASPWFRPSPAPPRDTPYFLYLGTLEPRKNVRLAMDAWREVRRTHPVDLVLAGRRRADFPAIAPEPGLVWRGPVSDAELPALYSGALACLYPSFYEGFGLPVLEAMQCGALVITSRDPAITEVTAGAAWQEEVTSLKDWVKAMRAAVEAPEGCQDLRRKAVERAAAFSWRRTALLTREVYEEARRRFER